MVAVKGMASRPKKRVAAKVKFAFALCGAAVLGAGFSALYERAGHFEPAFDDPMWNVQAPRQVALAGLSFHRTALRHDLSALPIAYAAPLEADFIIPPRAAQWPQARKEGAIALPDASMLRLEPVTPAATSLRNTPWEQPVVLSTLRLSTDRSEVRLAALALPNGVMSDAPLIEAIIPRMSEPLERAFTEIRGTSALASASVGVGAPSLPLNFQPSQITNDDKAPLSLGKPPSAALAKANPKIDSQDSPALDLKLIGYARSRQQKCLADAIYWEARSESRNGQIAVAQVVVNRALSGFYPKDLCGVVYQNSSNYLACQFTFACEGRTSFVPAEREYWQQAQDIAAQMLDGEIWLKEVGRATHYHTNYVRPSWARSMNRLKTIGAHIFYRPKNWS